MEQLVILDWVFLLVLLVSLCLGLMSGLVQAVIALGSWFVSYAVAQWGAQDLSVMLPLKDYEPPIPFMLAFALLFIASFMTCALVSWLLQRFLQAVGLRPIDRLLGAGFGFVRGFLVLVVVVSVVHLTPVRKMQWWQQSKGQEIVLSAIGMFQPLLPQEFTRYLPNGSHTVANTTEQSQQPSKHNASSQQRTANNQVYNGNADAMEAVAGEQQRTSDVSMDDLEAMIMMQQLGGDLHNANDGVEAAADSDNTGNSHYTVLPAASAGNATQPMHRNE